MIRATVMNMKKSSALSRRALLKSGGGLVIGLYLPFEKSFAQTPPAAPEINFSPNAFIRIGTDDTVTVLCKHIEFGQGPFTGMATLVAEELDADWAQMRAEHAPSNPVLYKNLLFGVQGTGRCRGSANSHRSTPMEGRAATG